MLYNLNMLVFISKRLQTLIHLDTRDSCQPTETNYLSSALYTRIPGLSVGYLWGSTWRTWWCSIPSMYLEEQLCLLRMREESLLQDINNILWSLYFSRLGMWLRLDVLQPRVVLYSMYAWLLRLHWLLAESFRNHSKLLYNACLWGIWDML